MRYWKSGRNGEKDNDFTCSGGGMVDAADLESAGMIRTGSNPVPSTI